MSRLEGFDNDLKIIHIGNLFRRPGDTRWHVSLWLNPRQTKPSTPLSNIPLLSRGRLINQTGHRRESGKQRTITISSRTLVNETKLSAYPRFGYKTLGIQEAKEHALRIQNPGRPALILPQLELARALFFPNAYLTRAAFSTTYLQQDFDVIRQGEVSEIRLLDTSSFPVQALSYPGTRAVLAWLLLDSNARTSFESINQCLMSDLDPVPRANWESWHFRFQPPNMDDWRLIVRGTEDVASGIMLAEEILSVRINVLMPRRVIYRHSSFIKASSEGHKDTTVALSPTTPRNFEIEDNSASEADETTIINNFRTAIEFNKPLETTKAYEDAGGATLGFKDDPSEYESEADSLVSTDEPGMGGSLRAGDFSGPEDLTDYTTQSRDRFTAFLSMLDHLRTLSGYESHDHKIVPLSAAGKSRKHELDNGTPRFICCAEVEFNGRRTYLLEIDTSDGKGMISTKLIFAPDPNEWPKYYRLLRQEVVLNSLNWPKSFLNRAFGVAGHRAVKHPRSTSQGAGHLPVEAIPGWAVRIAEHLRSGA